MDENQALRDMALREFGLVTVVPLRPLPTDCPCSMELLFFFREAMKNV